MRILIVGAGMAGMTLAALLDRRGASATVVERASSTTHAGYMLGLYALGSRVLHGLGLYEKFAGSSVECKRYISHDDHGDRIAEWSLDAIAGKHGALWSCTRPELVELLRSGLGHTTVRFGESITELAQRDGANEVRVTFSDGRVDTYDLVVGADGIGSTVRQLVFGPQPRFDSGWGGWVWWAPTDVCPPSTFVEFWGAGRFLGLYPSKRAVGVFAGAPSPPSPEVGKAPPRRGNFASAEGRRERLRRQFAEMGDTVDRVLSSLPGDGEEMFFWRLSDVRSSEWARGRVVLLGDASAGFLPTAGIGASMAMESAAVLADELERTDAKSVEHALALYIKRRRRRVESIQDESRKLARLMFVSSSTVTAIRNYASRFMTLERAMGSISRAFDEPI